AIACGSDRLRGLLTGRLEALQEVATTVFESRNHRLAGLPQRAGDVLAFLRQGMGDAPGSLVDLLGNELADLRNMVAEIEMDAVDGVANLAGLPDQRIALAGQVLQQRANANLVVVISMFERRNLVCDKGFELRCARQRALYAVAHGSDFASDRLPDR